MGEDDAVAAWVEGVREDQRRAEKAHHDNRAELIEALGHAVAAARRLNMTVYYGRAHAHINDLLDQMVGR